MTEGIIELLRITTPTCEGEVQLLKEEQCLGLLNYTNGFYYIGLGKIQNKVIIKEGFGYYHYDDGSSYFGQWKQEKKHGKGLFFYENGEVYYGDWENNNRKGTGIYFWSIMSSDKKRERYYQASIGEFDENKLIRGVMHYNNPQSNETENQTNQYLFIGEFNNKGEKDDSNGLVYDFKRKFFFIGNFKQDSIKDIGYEVFFDFSKSQVDKMVPVRMREGREGETEKEKGSIEEIWHYEIDIKSKETDKPELSKDDKENYETKVNKMFFNFIEGENIIEQLEKIFSKVIKYAFSIDSNTMIPIDEINELNKGIQDIAKDYPEWESLFPKKIMHSKSNIHQNNNEEKDIEGETEANTSLNTITGTTAMTND